MSVYACLCIEKDTFRNRGDSRNELDEYNNAVPNFHFCSWSFHFILNGWNDASKVNKSK